MNTLNVISYVSLLFFIFSAVCVEAQFTWFDCGVPGYRNIHYQSVTVSPYPAKTDSTNATLSINVEATIVNMIYSGDTYISIWQNGATFLEVKIASLCDIISTQNGLSCPIPVGKLSFTYTFTDIPELPQGEYMVKILSSVTSLGSTTDIGCLQLSGQVQGAVAASGCYYNSFVEAKFSQAAFDFPQSLLQRSVGSTFTVSSSSLTYSSSPDMATSAYMGQFKITGTGLVTERPNGTNIGWEKYSGNISLYYSNSPYAIYTGSFYATSTVDPSNPTTISSIEGYVILNPAYQYWPDYFEYPLTLGNMNPLDLKMSGSVLVLSGSQPWCTCAIDDCGVCGGNGESCSLGAVDKGLSAKAKAAIAIGVGGGILGVVLVAVLARNAKRARRAPLLNDQDLIDHPDKPDYGTMAIDEAIREGERV